MQPTFQLFREPLFRKQLIAQQLLQPSLRQLEHQKRLSGQQRFPLEFYHPSQLTCSELRLLRRPPQLLLLLLQLLLQPQTQPRSPQPRLPQQLQPY